MTMPMIIALAVIAFIIYLIMTDKVPFGAAPMIACVIQTLAEALPLGSASAYQL